MQDQLLHYGTKRHSGRYPWGSGDRPFQSTKQGKKLAKTLPKNPSNYTKDSRYRLSRAAYNRYEQAYKIALEHRETKYGMKGTETKKEQKLRKSHNPYKQYQANQIKESREIFDQYLKEYERQLRNAKKGLI